MKKELLIFDLDGTLLDSLKAIANSTNKALSFYGLKTYDYKEYIYFIGKGLRTLVEKIIEKEGYSNSVDEILDKLIEFYEKEYDYELFAYKGINKLLSYLDGNNIKYAVVTNKVDDLAKKAVLVKDLERFKFSDVIGVDNNKLDEKKPNPINVLRLIEKYNTTKEKTLFVGDMIVDYNTAMNAGVDFAYCNWGFGSLKNEEGIPDNLKFNTIEEIIKRYL